MVHAPTRDPGATPAHEPAQAPRRLDHVAPGSPSDGGVRLPWRAVVHPRDGDTFQTTWHLAGCAGPMEAAAHCAEGQRLLEAFGDPDGHCLTDGTCARCERLAAGT
jgi:hypothetical protein